MCQLSLLEGFVHAGLIPSAIYSHRSTLSFPSFFKLFYRTVSEDIGPRLSVVYPPFINVTIVKQITIGLTVLVSLLKWGWRMRGESGRVVYSFNISVPPGIFLLLGAWLTRSKCVAMVYDIRTPGEDVAATVINKIDFYMHKKLLPRFDGLVVIANSIVEDFAPNVPSLCIEGGISNDLVKKYKNISAIADKRGDVFTIVVAGTLSEINGISEILEAFARLDGTCYRLHIAGAGPLDALVMQAVENDDRITYHGYIKFDDVLQLYAEADVLVSMRITDRINTRYFYPSKTIELLATGVPVITTCAGNIAEEYTNLAYLLCSETAEALADMIVSVSSIPREQRIARGHAAQQYVSGYKTWDAQSIKIIEYLEMVSKS